MWVQFTYILAVLVNSVLEIVIMCNDFSNYSSVKEVLSVFFTPLSQKLPQSKIELVGYSYWISQYIPAMFTVFPALHIHSLYLHDSANT